jgi:hypothetical protein
MTPTRRLAAIPAADVHAGEPAGRLDDGGCRALVSGSGVDGDTAAPRSATTDWMTAGVINTLPNIQLARIERRKVTDYLLATSHSAGRAKAAFFARFGFTVGAWQQLRDALLLHERSAPVVSVWDTPFGGKYILEGPLASPDGRSPRIRAVWF